MLNLGLIDMIDFALIDERRKKLEELNIAGQSSMVILGIEKLKNEYLKKEKFRSLEILYRQEKKMAANNELLEMMYSGDNKLIKLVDDLNAPYGQAFQLDIIKKYWNQKSPDDEQFLAEYTENMKIITDYLNSLPIVKQKEKAKQQLEQLQIKLDEMNKVAAKKDKIRKKLEAKLKSREAISASFIDVRKKMLAELQEWNEAMEVEMSRSRSKSQCSSDSEDKEHEKVQQMEPILIVAPAVEPKRLKKMVLPKFNFEDVVFPTRAEPAAYISPISQYEPSKMMGNNMTAPNRSQNNRNSDEFVRFDQEIMMAPHQALPVPAEDFQRESQILQTKRKLTDDFIDSFKSTKQPKTRHSDKTSGDIDDRRKLLAGFNEENVTQHGERQLQMRTAGSSSAQEDRHGPMAPIKRSPYKNDYDNRSAANNDAQRDSLQFNSAVDTRSHSNMVQPVSQRSLAFVAYGSQQQLLSSYPSPLSPEDRAKMPHQTGRVSDHGHKVMPGDGGKSSSHRDDEATMHYSSAGRDEHGRTSLENRSTMPQQTGRKSDPMLLRQNQFAKLANANYGRNKSMPGDERKPSSSRDAEATMLYPGQKPEMRKSISPAKQRGGHGSADASMYDDRQKQHSETRRETAQAPFSRDEKMDGLRGPNKPKEHGFAPNASSKHKTEPNRIKPNSGDEEYALSSTTSNRQNRYANENYGRNQSMPGDGRKSSSSRDAEATMPYPEQKPEMRKSISPDKQRSGHKSADATMYDDRQKQQSETRRETTQTPFNQDEKMDGQRGPNKPKEHGLTPNAPSTHKTETKNRADALSSATSKRCNQTLVDNNHGTENRQSGRKSDSSFSSFPKQRHHGNTTNVSGSGGPIQPEFLVPTAKPSDIKQKMEHHPMKQSKSGARDSPAPSIVSSVRSSLSFVGSEGTNQLLNDAFNDMSVLGGFDSNWEDFDSYFEDKFSSSYKPSESGSERRRPESSIGGKSPDAFDDWAGFNQNVTRRSPLSESDFPDFAEEPGCDEIVEGFEDH